MTRAGQTIGARDRHAKAAVWAGAVLAIAMGAAGAETRADRQDCLIEGHRPVKNEEGKLKSYHVARWPISLAPHAVGAQRASSLERLIEVPEHIPEMGTFYRSAFETDDAVLLGHYVGLDELCFTKLQGWAAREDLIETSASMRVGEVVRNNEKLAEKLRKRYPAGRNLIEERSRVHMRVLMRPERLTRPRLMPSDDAPENHTAAIGDTYFWRYVYDVHTDDEGEIWYLLGTHPSLIRKTVHSTEQQLREMTSVKRLQGWVREDAVVPWPTNIVLELNAHEDAVRERFPDIEHTPECPDGAGGDIRGYAPGTIIERRPQEYDHTAGAKAIAQERGIRLIAYESCSLWDEAFKKPTKGGGDANFLPKGLGSSTVRAHVQEIDEDGWARVATLGSLTGTVSTGERTKARRAMLNVIRSISEIEMVLLIDATGSMFEEVHDVGRALKTLHNEMYQGAIGKVHIGKFPSLRDASGIDASELDIEVKVSLMLFSDVDHDDSEGEERMRSTTKWSELPRTGHIFKRLSLRSELPQILHGINEAVTIVRENKNVSGGKEATLHGLAKAIDDDTFWGDPMLGQQLIVLVTDEAPTEARGMDRDKLARRYRTKTKTIYGAAREKAKEYGYEILGGQFDGTQRDFLWGIIIFTGGQEQLEGLQEAVAPLGIFDDEQIQEIKEENRAVLTDAEYTLAVGAIIDAVNNEQARIERMATMLERCATDPAQCVERTESRVSATGMKASKSEVERIVHALVVEGVPTSTVINEIENGLVEGYTQLKTEGKRSTWRQAVMLNHDQMHSYSQMLRALVYGLESRHDFDRCDSREADLIRLVVFLREIAVERPSSPDAAHDIARKERHINIDEACANADAMLTDGVSGTIFDRLNMPHVLPLDSEGLFGMELDKLKGTIEESTDIERRIVQFIKRAECIQAMSPIVNRLLPEQALDPDEPEPENYCSPDLERAFHDWTVRVSYRYGGRYVFIPIELLP